MARNHPNYCRLRWRNGPPSSSGSERGLVWRLSQLQRWSALQCSKVWLSNRQNSYQWTWYFFTEDLRILEKYLQSYSVEALQGFAFCSDALKSLILTVACVERRLAVRNRISKLKHFAAQFLAILFAFCKAFYLQPQSCLRITWRDWI